MNKFKGSVPASGGTYEYEAMWSTSGRRIFWDSRVTRDGTLIGAPGGIIVDTSEEMAPAAIRTALHEAIQAGLRRQSERTF
jgi:hypothetical protein